MRTTFSAIVNAFAVFIASTTVATSSALAASFTEVAQPTSVKVRTVFNAWESFENPNLCHPDAITFKVMPPIDGNWDELILQATQQVSSDVEKLETFAALATEAEVRAAATELLEGMGMVDDPEFGGKLFRVYQKTSARLVFKGTTNGATELEGRFIAIADLENNELVLLTDGDAFGASRCEE